MLTPGTILQNRYQIIRSLGGGGMGEVYLAYDLHLRNRQVVVKENRGGDPQLFYAEANILATLHHPNLPRVIDHFIEPNQSQYLVMDYIAGQTLGQVTQARGMLTERDALAWMYQVLDAVRYLHANHIIHRDIKPQNIIITPDGRAVLVDFGIAKVMQPGQATVTGARGFGSPGYASPEHYTGGTDERSDVYALGATLYFALTGSPPPSVPERAGGAALVSIRLRNASVSAKMENAILKAVELRSAQRHQSVVEMEQALRAIAPTIPVRAPMSPSSASPKWLIAGMGLGIAALALFSLIMIVVFATRGTPPTPSALAFATYTRAPATSVPVSTQLAVPTQLPIVTVIIATRVSPTAMPTVTATPVPPAASRTPTRPVVTATAIALPLRYGAPRLLNPIWTDDRKDEAKFPGGAIIFDWLSVGGLGGDECYLVQVATEPVNPGAGIGAASDYLLTNCGDQTQTGLIVKATNAQHSFTLESPNRVGTAPNYGSILLNTDQMWANWSLTVVKNLGQCDAAYQYHCKWAPISPPGKGRFLFRRE